VALVSGWQLFGQGQYYHAHDVWEAVWQPLPVGPDKCLVQALIQWTVSWHHYSEGNLKGARRLLAKALAVLECFEALGQTERLGCQLPAITDWMRQQSHALASYQSMDSMGLAPVAQLFKAPTANPSPNIAAGLADKV
jgi:Domain of unknown function (DUF309)